MIQNHQIRTMPVLVLYPHARCNCRCIMCDIWKDPSQAKISTEELARHLEDIEQLQVKWVVFSGGEPLMHPDLFRLANMLRIRRIKVTVLSTGLLLHRYASQITAHIDDLIVSLDGPPNTHDQIRRVTGATDLLSRGITAVLEQNPAFQIAARCTVQRANHDVLVDTARFANQVGIQSISFLAADLTTTAFNREAPWSDEHKDQVALTQKQTQVLAGQFEQLDAEWSGTGFVRESKEKLQRIVSHFQGYLGLTQTESPKCNAPWVSAVVETDGTVRPCFFQPSIGSLTSQSLLQVLNGFEAQTFRASLNVATNPVCRRCVCSLYWKD